MFPILKPLLPPSPYHPSGSSQCTSPKHPVSCIEPGLAIRFIYDVIHVSMPFSQIIPPSLSPTESKRLFYTSVSLLMSCKITADGDCSHEINKRCLILGRKFMTNLDTILKSRETCVHLWRIHVEVWQNQYNIVK